MDISTSMAQERKLLEKLIDNEEIKNKEEAEKYAKALMQLIWNHKMLGLVYEHYHVDILYRGANGKKLVSQEEVQMEFLAFQAAFPDLKVHITETFSAPDGVNGYKIYIRSYCDGTNSGPSQYGPPTGETLNEQNSFGQNIYIFKKEKDGWKITNEYAIRSDYAIEQLLQSGSSW